MYLYISITFNHLNFWTPWNSPGNHPPWSSIALVPTWLRPDPTFGKNGSLIMLDMDPKKNTSIYIQYIYFNINIYIYIPGSSNCVKCGPFHKNLPKGRIGSRINLVGD